MFSTLFGFYNGHYFLHLNLVAVGHDKAIVVTNQNMNIWNPSKHV